jgi:hypothetical protein
MDNYSKMNAANYSKVVTVETLVEVMDKEMEMLMAQHQLKVKELRAKYKRVPYIVVKRALICNMDIRTPESSAKLFMEDILRTITDLRDKGWISEKKKESMFV